MAKHGKRYTDAAARIGDDTHSPQEAVALARELASAKFDEAVELHVATTADVRHADQQMREVAALPHGTGKDVRVFVFAEGETAQAAKDAGADYVVDEDLTKRIEAGWADFDIAIATPDMMPKIARLGRFLGRKGLMPNPRTGTVVQPQEIASAIESAKRGRTEVRLDKTAVVHTRIGSSKFTDEQLLDNLASVYSTIARSKPSGVKGNFVKSASLCTTMGPGIRLDVSALESLAKEAVS